MEDEKDTSPSDGAGAEQEASQGPECSEAVPPTRRQRLVDLAQKLIILAGGVAALWLAWKAFGPQPCNLCGKKETGTVAKMMNLERGGAQER